MRKESKKEWLYVYAELLLLNASQATLILALDRFLNYLFLPNHLLQNGEFQVLPGGG